MVYGLWFMVHGDRLRVGEVSRGEKMALRGTDPESYITEYTLVYEEYISLRTVHCVRRSACTTLSSPANRASGVSG